MYRVIYRFTIENKYLNVQSMSLSISYRSLFWDLIFNIAYNYAMEGLYSNKITNSLDLSVKYLKHSLKYNYYSN